MITVTPAAARQIRAAAAASDADELALRIAARRDAEGSLHYAMGFDQAGGPDLRMASEGIDLVVAPAYCQLLTGMTLDYVEFEPGDFRFIFINPNDAPASPPSGSGNGVCAGAGAMSPPARPQRECRSAPHEASPANAAARRNEE